MYVLHHPILLNTNSMKPTLLLFLILHLHGFHISMDLAQVGRGSGCSVTLMDVVSGRFISHSVDIPAFWFFSWEIPVHITGRFVPAE